MRTFKGNYKNQTNFPNVIEIRDWNEIEQAKFDCAFITNPTSLHVPTAIECAKRNISIYLEKPLSHTLEGIDKLGELVEKKKILCFVAYVLRYHPGIQWVKNYLVNRKIYHVRCRCTSYLPNWRPAQNYKESYSSHSEMGGGVVLDLSHEIDYLTYLFGKVKAVKHFTSRVADVTVDSEDFADILLKFENCYANLHLNFLSQNSERVLEIDLPGEYLKLDLVNDELTKVTNGKKELMKFTTTRNIQFIEMIKDYLKKLHTDFDYYKEFQKEVEELKLLLKIRRSI